MSAAKAKRTNLGRGLSALLGEEEAQAVAPTNEDAGAGAVKATQTLPVEYLRPGRYQPRHRFDDEAIDDLVNSVRDKGILQPILVRSHPDEAGSYEIIAGERRWRAAQQAQLHEVPVIVREFDDVQALEVALVENLQRQDLNPLEEAEGYARLMAEFSHTQEALAQAVGKSRSHVANMMRLLNLPDDVKGYVETGKLSAGHARALLGAPDAAAIAEKIVKRGLNVRQTEKLVRKSENPQTRPRKGKATTGVDDKDADTLALERDLSAQLGLKVEINFHGSGGEVVIEYDNLEQLDDILNKLSGASPRAMAS